METEVSNPETIEMITRGKLTFPYNHKHWKGNMERGWYMGLSQIHVYIRKMPTDEAAVQITREVSALKLSGYVHENIVRFIASETTELLDGNEKKNFTLIATEQCLGSVADLFNGSEIFRQETIKTLLHPSGKFDPRWILRQATDGLAFLHSLGWIHRNIKPNNFLISVVSEGKYIVKLTDMRHSKFWKDAVHSGTCDPVWKSPELPGRPIDLKMDVFVLGCFYHFVLSKGVHPFGSSFEDTNRNIRRSNFDVYKVDWQAENVHHEAEKRVAAIDLIKKMIRFKLADRCTISDALSHEYFSPTSDYLLYSKQKPGLCLIINQREFCKNKEMRAGTDEDERKLSTTFRQLGFDVVIQRDLKGSELVWSVRQFATSPVWSEYACMALCILSHGSEQVVQGTDLQEVRINKLKYFFNEKESPHLQEKPKMFIIQACQGHRHMLAHVPLEAKDVYTGDIVGTGPKEASPSSSKKHEEKEEKHLKIAHPPIRDTLDMLSTIPEFVSFRSEREGAWFIQTLCQELDKINENGQNIYELFRRVENEITNKTFTAWVDTAEVSQLEGTETRQIEQKGPLTRVMNWLGMSVKKSGLEQKLYFSQTCELRSTLYENLILRKCQTPGQRLKFDGSYLHLVADDLQQHK